MNCAQNLLDVCSIICYRATCCIPASLPELTVMAMLHVQDLAPVLASPAVRRVARERSVDLAAVAGTGAGGRITRGDAMFVSPWQGSRWQMHMPVNAGSWVRKQCRCQQMKSAVVMCCSRRLSGCAEDILEHSEQTAQAPPTTSKQQLAWRSSQQQQQQPPAAQASDFLHQDGGPVVKQIRQAAIVVLPYALS